MAVLLAAQCTHAGDWGLGVSAGQAFMPTSVSEALGRATQVRGYFLEALLIKYHHDSGAANWGLAAGRGAFDIKPEQIGHALFTVPGRARLTSYTIRKYVNICGDCVIGFMPYFGVGIGLAEIKPDPFYGVASRNRIVPVPDIGLTIAIRPSKRASVDFGIGFKYLIEAPRGMVMGRF